MSGRIYWSARDLAGSPIGNHHFLLIVFESKKAAQQVEAAYDIATKSEKVGQKTTYFLTLGGFSEQGQMVFKANESSDVTAVREWIDPEEHTAWYRPDLDLENHQIAPGKIGATGSELIGKVIQAAQTYKRKGPVPYDLADQNCSSWVNTLLKAIGFSKSYREERGEFFGIDWGEEDELDVSLFKD